MDKGSIWKSYGKIIVVAVCYLIMFFILSINSSIPVILGIVCAIFGWSTLNKIQPAMFLWMPIGGWLIYVLIKLILSIMIGIFVAPYKIGCSIADAFLNVSE